MRTNIVIYWLLGGFFLFLAVLYTWWNHQSSGQTEWFGTIAFAFGGAMMCWFAFYLQLVQKKQGAALPEDRLDADIDDGEPEIGHFQPWSWWPIVLALTASLVVLGIGLKFWLTFLSVPLLIISVVGWVFEDYRGRFAR